MYNNHQDILDSGRAAPQILQSLLRGCSTEDAYTKRGGDENWNVVEVVCHLRDAEERALERLRMMRDEDSPRLAAYNQDGWARERNYAAANLAEALAAFEQFRTQYLSALERLTAEQWERPGVHAEHGRITILNQAIHMVAHDATHLAQVAEQLAHPSSLAQ